MTNSGTGYVERFISETAQISQLFCHQIIWNMTANCYKDDAAEVVTGCSVVYCITIPELSVLSGGSNEANA